MIESVRSEQARSLKGARPLKGAQVRQGSETLGSLAV